VKAKKSRVRKDVERSATLTIGVYPCTSVGTELPSNRVREPNRCDPSRRTHTSPVLTMVTTKGMQRHGAGYVHPQSTEKIKARLVPRVKEPA